MREIFIVCVTTAVMCRLFGLALAAMPEQMRDLVARGLRKLTHG